MIFVFGSPYFDVFPTNNNVLFSTMLVFAFGLLALVFRQWPALAHYTPPVYALFVAAAANLALVTGSFNRYMPATTEPFHALGQDKLIHFLTVVPVLVALFWLAWRDAAGSRRRRLELGDQFGRPVMDFRPVANVRCRLRAGQLVDREAQLGRVKLAAKHL